MTANIKTEDSIIEVKTIREQFIGRTEVLDKVKELFLIPKLEVMTTKQVANYFEVGVEAIQSTYKRNKNEIDSDGVLHKNPNDFGLSKTNNPKTSKQGITTLSLENGSTLEINNRGVKCFSKRAILRIAMLLRDSEIAKEIRTQLLNTFEVATVEQRIETIKTEQEIMANSMRIFFEGTKEEFAFAIKEYIDFQRRHIDELENTNKDLRAENTALAIGINTWGSQSILNALIRSLAYNAYRNNFRLAWNTYYKRLSYKKGISLSKREGKGTLIDRIQDNEWDDCIQVAAAMCLSYGLDIGIIINEINAENILPEVENN